MVLDHVTLLMAPSPHILNLSQIILAGSSKAKKHAGTDAQLATMMLLHATMNEIYLILVLHVCPNCTCLFHYKLGLPS